MLSQQISSVVKTSRNIIMLGKAGHGKSATGNSIVGRMAFQTSARCRSQTKTCQDAWAQSTPYNVKVVDTPGLEDTDLNQAEDKMTACTNIGKALFMCDGGVDAFVVVTKFGTRFTKEEKTVLSDLKQILGPDYLRDHGIVAVTHGDEFERELHRQGEGRTDFNEWCKEDDGGEMNELIKECNNRVVLFDNFTENSDKQEVQRNTLLKYTEKLSEENGLYTSENYNICADFRKELIQKKQALFVEEVQKNISNLAAEILQLSGNPELRVVECLYSRTDSLQKEIMSFKQMDETNQTLIKKLEEIRQITGKLKLAVTRNNTAKIQLRVAKLKKLARELEAQRQLLWNGIVIILLGSMTLFTAHKVIKYVAPRIFSAVNDFLSVTPDSPTPGQVTTVATAPAMAALVNTLTAGVNATLSLTAEKLEKLATSTSVIASNYVEISKVTSSNIIVIAATVPVILKAFSNITTGVQTIVTAVPANAPAAPTIGPAAPTIAFAVPTIATASSAIGSPSC